MKKIVKQILKCLYIFPLKKNTILLMCFNGKSYGYDSKAIAEYAKTNFPQKYNLIWACDDVKKWKNKKISGIELVKIGSLQYCIALITSGVVIYNINPPSYIPFRSKQILCNTWHGFAFKRVGKYIHGSFNKEQFSTSTVFMSHSKWYTEQIIRGSFCFEGEVIASGVPRNDIFFSDRKYEANRKIRSLYGIEMDTHILLYAPTFRGNYSLNEDIPDFEHLIKSLSCSLQEKWVILFRMHPLVKADSDFRGKEFFDVSSYEDMQDLLCAADILVSDYSGSMWDFSQMKKPVFCYVSDLEAYENDRGLYIELDKLPFCLVRSTDDLIDKIINFDISSYTENLNRYLYEMGNYECGKACHDLFEYIDNQIQMR